MPVMQPALKDWRSFGVAEWKHVGDGALGFVLGSAIPLILFYLALRGWSFTAAVLVMLAWSAGVFVWHRVRTRGRLDVFSAATFLFACLEALIGLASQNVYLYLATPSLKNLVYALVFLGSALLGRPLIALYAERLYPIPASVRGSAEFRRIFLVVSLVWFFGLIGRGLVRLWLLATLPFELYLVVDNTLAGWAFSATLVSFTVWYPLKELRRVGLLGGNRPTTIDTGLAEGLEAATTGVPAASR